MRRLVRRAFRGRRASRAASGCGSPPRAPPAARCAAAPRAGPARRGSRVLVAEIERQRAADDRLDAVAGELLGEFQRAEHVVGVGQRQRRLAVGLGELGELADRSARLRAANRRSARADARSRGRRSREASVIRFQAMVGTRASPVHLHPEPHRFSPRRSAIARSLLRWRSALSGRRLDDRGGTAVMAREPGKPGFRCHPRPLGDGGADVDTRGRRA